MLQDNDFVELFNVNISLWSVQSKTIKKNAIKAYLNGTAQNLKIVNTEEEISFRYWILFYFFLYNICIHCRVRERCRIKR